MSTFTKRNFLGGMNSQQDATKVDPQNQYYLGVNVRVRKNIAEPVKDPLEITPPVNGHIQGIYTFDTLLLVFIGGNAYVSQDEGNNWLVIPSLAMSPTVDTINCALVPSSTVNFTRFAPNTTTQEDNEVILKDVIGSSPQCLIVMDGVTQPWIIFPNATARITQNYDQWSLANPEYVPIGNFPLFYDGILYCMGKDENGRLTQMFRSVSGRPLDFIILVTKAGAKVSTLESEGGAPVLANRVSYNEVTCMAVLNTIQNSIYVATTSASFVVQPDYVNTIAAEPQFNNVFLFDVGAVNNNCVVSILGDAVVTGKSGIRSFNGVMQFRWDGKNAPFSAPVNNFISLETQHVAASVTFDNYGLFALNTAFGPGVLVYDMLLEAFVSVDLYTNVGAIKQFAAVQSGTIERLYAYTTDNKLYKMFAGPTGRKELYLCDFTPQLTLGAHRVVGIDCDFSNIITDGYVEAVAYSDRVPFFSGAQLIKASDEVTNTPIVPPFNVPISSNGTAQPTFNFLDDTRNAWRATAGIIWNADAALLEVNVTFIESDSYTKHPAEPTVPIDNTTILAIGNDGVVNDERINVNLNMRATEGDYTIINAGDMAFSTGSQADIDLNLAPYWNPVKELGRFLGVHGAVDLDTDNGEPLYRWLRQGPNHYSRHMLSSYVEVFLITAGFNTTHSQVEPSNTTAPTIIASEQMQWLKNALADSTATQRIVVWYNAQYSSDSSVIPELTDIPLKAWGATLLITGAGHTYERLELDSGLTELNIGTGGNDVYTGPTTPIAQSRRIVQAFGFVKLKISPLRITGKFVAMGGDVLDQFVI